MSIQREEHPIMREKERETVHARVGEREPFGSSFYLIAVSV